MGQAKKLMMEYEELYSIIDHLIILISENSFYDLPFVNQIVMDLYEIKDTINSIDHTSINNLSILADVLNGELQSIYTEINTLVELEDFHFNNKYKISDNGKELINKLRHEVRRIKARIKSILFDKQPIFNSEKYYIEQINELKQQKESLQEFLINQNDIFGKTEDEINIQKKEFHEKEIELELANEQIRNYKKELEEKKKQENAIDEWNQKIKTTFSELKACISPIDDEHSRLNRMFWIYSVLIAIVIISFIILEITIFCKLNNIANFPKIEDYLATVLPIPVLGALLWVFVIQLNRTQRQLVILAKHIHEIKYVEGLLLSVNSLSSDISDSTKRVNNAIDRLIDNHLSASATTGFIDENSILNEEKKDKVPYDTLIKLLQEIKGIVGK